MRFKDLLIIEKMFIFRAFDRDHRGTFIFIGATVRYNITLQFEQLHDDAMTKDVSVCGHASHDPVSRSLPPSWAVSSAPPKISDIAKRLICVVKHNL